MLKPCCRNLLRIAYLFDGKTDTQSSSFNRTACLYTWQSWLKTGLLPIAVNSLVKMNGLRIHPTSTLWTTLSGEQCLNATSHFNPSQRTSTSLRKFCSWYETSCHRTLSTSHIELPEKTSGLCESWWWKLRTYAKMNSCQILVFVITGEVS